MKLACLPLLSILSVSTAGQVEVFLEGAALTGGVNGIQFDSDGLLWSCQVLGNAISGLDPETGAVLDVLTAADSALYPDDIAISSNGTFYWTDLVLGTLFKRQNNETTQLFPPATYPSANPLVLSEDESKLYFGQCFFSTEPFAVYEVDLATNVVTTLVGEIPLCSSNSMAIWDNELYSPRVFENRVVKIGLANESHPVVDVATGLLAPVAVAFDSQGNLHVADPGVGKIYKIDTEATDLANNRELVADTTKADPSFISIDNIVFDKDDRLFVSSFLAGSVHEVLGVNSFRTVSPGSFTMVTGIALMGNVLYLNNPLSYSGYDIDSRERIDFYHAPDFIDERPAATNIVAYSANTLVLLSFTANIVALWNTEELRVTAVVDEGSGLGAAADALVLLDSSVLVTNAASGEIMKFSGADLSSIQVLTTVPGAYYIAGNDEQVYVSLPHSGTVLKIVENGELLETPTRITTNDLAFPEGMALLEGGEKLLVLTTGGPSGTLNLIDLATGNITVLAEDLGLFLVPIPGVSPFGWANKVIVHEGYAFVSSDNNVYKIALNEEAASSAKKPENSCWALLSVAILGSMFAGL